MLPQKISSLQPSISTTGSEVSLVETQQIEHQPHPVSQPTAAFLDKLQSMRRKPPRRLQVGLTLDIAKMRQKEAESLDRLRHVSNGSTHFHGSRSGSLITFHPSTNAEIRGSLLPMGTLLAHKAAVYSGERGYSLEDNAFNVHHLSVVGEENFDQAVRYATDTRYASSSPIRSRPPVSISFGARGSSDKAKQLNEAAAAKLDELGADSMMTHFVNANFPLIYGLQPSRDEVVGVSSSVPGECGIRGGCDCSQISVVFVPDEEVPSVKAYLGECGFQISVESLSSVKTG